MRAAIAQPLGLNAALDDDTTLVEMTSKRAEETIRKRGVDEEVVGVQPRSFTHMMENLLDDDACRCAL